MGNDCCIFTLRARPVERPGLTHISPKHSSRARSSLSGSPLTRRVSEHIACWFSAQAAVSSPSPLPGNSELAYFPGGSRARWLYARKAGVSEFPASLARLTPSLRLRTAERNLSANPGSPGQCLPPESRGRSSMVEPLPSKQNMRVRFPLAAPIPGLPAETGMTLSQRTTRA